jgi:hypothetical protein
LSDEKENETGLYIMPVRKAQVVADLLNSRKTSYFLCVEKPF